MNHATFPTPTLIRSAAAWLLFIAAILLLVRLELYSDDAGVIVFIVLLCTFLLGCLDPRLAWLWALTGWSVPAAGLFGGALPPALYHIPGALVLLAFMTALGLAGSYSGVWFRRLLRISTAG